MIPIPDGDEVELFTHLGSPDSPHILLLHGLEGSLRSHYSNGILAAAADAGWSAHIMLFRSCGTKVNLTRRFYHSGETGDARQVIGRLGREFPKSAICLVGVSLGGNVLVKLLGEDPAALPVNVRAAAVISVPYDLARSAEAISRGFSRVYQRFFLETLKAKLIEKKKVFADLPDAGKIAGLKTMVAFDDLVTAPLHGFDDALDYYRKSSAIGYLDGIRLPTLLLSAYDDPFLPRDILEQVASKARRNPALHIDFHQRGGHVGFISGRFPWSARYYADRRILEFFAKYVERPDQLGEGSNAETR
ncbi:MAG: hypothetical protein M3Z17_00855 [Gemmatimonadota bacterium]|nr:hypothetical protein [Gemmatimonadota bacterium]